jgi:hypothetical protein
MEKIMTSNFCNESFIRKIILLVFLLQLNPFITNRSVRPKPFIITENPFFRENTVKPVYNVLFYNELPLITNNIILTDRIDFFIN